MLKRFFMVMVFLLGVCGNVWGMQEQPKQKSIKNLITEAINEYQTIKNSVDQKYVENHQAKNKALENLFENIEKIKDKKDKVDQILNAFYEINNNFKLGEVIQGDLLSKFTEKFASIISNDVFSFTQVFAIKILNTINIYEGLEKYFNTIKTIKDDYIKSYFKDFFNKHPAFIYDIIIYVYKKDIMIENKIKLLKDFINFYTTWLLTPEETKEYRQKFEKVFKKEFKVSDVEDEYLEKYEKILHYNDFEKKRMNDYLTEYKQNPEMLEESTLNELKGGLEDEWNALLKKRQKMVEIQKPDYHIKYLFETDKSVIEEKPKDEIKIEEKEPSDPLSMALSLLKAKLFSLAKSLQKS